MNDIIRINGILNQQRRARELLERAQLALRDALIELGRHPTYHTRYEDVRAWFDGQAHLDFDLDRLLTLADSLVDDLVEAGFIPRDYTLADGTGGRRPSRSMGDLVEELQERPEGYQQ